MRASFIITFMVILACITNLLGQVGRLVPEEIIQFTGKVVTADARGEVIPLPYTNVSIEGTSRGAVSEWDGYFSFVAIKGERVVFSRLGYNTVSFIIPDTMTNSFYSWIQIMSQDDILLNEVVIYPWPDKEHFKHEFFAINIEDELRTKAEENLAQEVLAEIRYSVPADGRESTNIYMKQQAADFKYSGQIKPQRIFDVMAWKSFIEAWKRGDFKKKEK